MGKRPGRLCLIHQDVEEFKYEITVKGKRYSGRLDSIERFYEAVDEILGLYRTDKVEIALKQFSKDNINGICVKSFPATLLSSQLISVCRLCSGGETGNDLVILPNEGGLLDQLNIFVEGYIVFINERGKWFAEMRPKQTTDGPDR